MTVRRSLPLVFTLTTALLVGTAVPSRAGAGGACCTGITCSIGPALECTSLGGAYQGDGTVCTSDLCAPPPLNHFQCYDVARTKFDPVTLNLEDDFGTSTATVRRAKMLCAPVNKNAEDPNAPTDADHLVGYEIRRSDRFAGVLDEVVEDQFGTLVLDIRRPERILVPSAKQADPNDVVLPLDPAVVDHYQCYSVRGDRRRVAGIDVEDQFGTGTADVKKPSRLCLPVNKNGEGIVDGAARLMCYAIKPGPRVNTTVQINNQLGDDELRVKRARELCVPLTNQLLSCPCWDNFTADELRATMNEATQIATPECGVGVANANATSNPTNNFLIGARRIQATADPEAANCSRFGAGAQLVINISVATAIQCRAEIVSAIPDIAWCP